ncbi:hypothetical protein NE237_005651 [Protea cynaroides]|uniref:Uncharacterized protein n=1 Tax=Protea cynaroides TaxID=273540 RepID=A0A9Q0QUP8_9MAGN|nr:hypothetical protein NE237_005651 [Protea cynaroides]
MAFCSFPVNVLFCSVFSRHYWSKGGHGRPYRPCSCSHLQGLWYPTAAIVGGFLGLVVDFSMGNTAAPNRVYGLYNEFYLGVNISSEDAVKFHALLSVPETINGVTGKRCRELQGDMVGEEDAGEKWEREMAGGQGGARQGLGMSPWGWWGGGGGLQKRRESPEKRTESGLVTRNKPFQFI